MAISKSLPLSPVCWWRRKLRRPVPGLTIRRGGLNLLVINKTDLAPYVGADLAVMQIDTVRIRTTAKGLKPFVMINLKTNTVFAHIVAFIKSKGMFRT